MLNLFRKIFAAPQVPAMATSGASGQNVEADRATPLCDERPAGGSNPAVAANRSWKNTASSIRRAVAVYDDHWHMAWMDDKRAFDPHMVNALTPHDNDAIDMEFYELARSAGLTPAQRLLKYDPPE